MVLSRPIAYGLYNVFAHHRLVGGNFIATRRSVRIPALGSAVIVIRNGLLEAAMLNVVGMVIYHIHDNTKSRLMKCLHHLLKFADAHSTVERICGIRAFRHIVIDRVISPVILRNLRMCLINTAEIIGRHNLHMCNAKL